MRDQLWTTGVCDDDRDALDAALLSDPSDAGLRLFRSWLAVEDQQSPLALAVPNESHEQLLAAAVSLRDAVNRRDAKTIEVALSAIDDVVRRGEDGPALRVARGYADVAIADAAMLGNDLRSARSCLDGAASCGVPRIEAAAHLRKIALDLPRDPTRALASARRAVELASDRPQSARRAQLAVGMLSYLAGDREGARAALAAIARSTERESLLATLLIAAIDPSEDTIVLLADALRACTDPFAFAVCTIAGARCYAELGRDADALVTLASARVTLDRAAPSLAELVGLARDTLVASWGPERAAAAEAAAHALLDRDLARPR